jgi:hypothetical protein
MRLLKEDVESRPWATHRQRSEFLAIVVRGVEEVSEATVCRAIKRLGESPKKDLRQSEREGRVALRVLWRTARFGTLDPRLLVFVE